MPDCPICEVAQGFNMKVGEVCAYHRQGMRSVGWVPASEVEELRHLAGALLHMATGAPGARLIHLAKARQMLGLGLDEQWVQRLAAGEADDWPVPGPLSEESK